MNITITAIKTLLITPSLKPNLPSNRLKLSIIPVDVEISSVGIATLIPNTGNK